MLLGTQRGCIRDLLLEIFNELFLTSPWELCFDLIISYIAIALVAEKKEIVLTSIRKRLSYENQHEDLYRVVDSYWSVKDQTLSKYGRKKIDSHIEIAVPEPEAGNKPIELLDAIKHCYQQIVSEIAKFIM